MVGTSVTSGVVGCVGIATMGRETRVKGAAVAEGTRVTVSAAAAARFPAATDATLAGQLESCATPSLLLTGSLELQAQPP